MSYKVGEHLQHLLDDDTSFNLDELENDVVTVILKLEENIPKIADQRVLLSTGGRLLCACRAFLKQVDPDTYSGLYVNLTQEERDALVWDRPGADCKHDGLLRKVIDPNDLTKTVGCRCAKCDGRAMFREPR